MVELRLDLLFQQRPFLFDHQNFLEPAGKGGETLWLQGPGDGDLEHLDADARRLLAVDAEMIEGLPHVEIRFPGRDDAEARARAVERCPVEVVGAHVCKQRRQPLVVDAPLHRQRLVRQAQAQAAGWQREVGRQAHDHAVRIDIHRRGALDGLVERLERNPQARVARHRVAVQAEVEVLLHSRGREHRNHRRHHHVFALRGHGRRARHVVVAADEQHAAERRRAGRIGVIERIAAAADTRPFAVPHAEHAVVAGLAIERDLLRAPDADGGEFLVLARLEVHVAGLEQRARLVQRLVHVVEWRALVAGYETRRVVAGRCVALPLHDEQARQRLQAGQVHAPAGKRVLVFEGDVGKLHDGFSEESAR